MLCCQEVRCSGRTSTGLVVKVACAGYRHRHVQRSGCGDERCGRDPGRLKARSTAPWSQGTAGARMGVCHESSDDGGKRLDRWGWGGTGGGRLVSCGPVCLCEGGWARRRDGVLRRRSAVLDRGAFFVSTLTWEIVVAPGSSSSSVRSDWPLRTPPATSASAAGGAAGTSDRTG